MDWTEARPPGSIRHLLWTTVWPVALRNFSVPGDPGVICSTPESVSEDAVGRDSMRVSLAFRRQLRSFAIPRALGSRGRDAPCSQFTLQLHGLPRLDHTGIRFATAS